MRVLANVLLLVGMTLCSSCTTYVRPVACDPGSNTCGGIQDARFCENLALEVSGADCAPLGLSAQRPFCVATPMACTDTHYAVRGRDCQIVSYRTVRESERQECAPGAPVFASR